MNNESHPITKTKAQKTINQIKEESMAYFVDGFDLTENQDILRNKLLATIPILKTKIYRESLLTIITSFTQLQKFSNNLQGKVDCLLQAQQTQFVQSYKGHIRNIKNQFDRMNDQIEKLSEKVRYYENQGQMSKLVKKVFNLQSESSNLYKKLKDKDKKIKDLQMMMQLKEDQIYSLQQKIKNNVKQRTETLNKEQQASRTLHSDDKNMKSQELFVFTTQVKKKISMNPHFSFHDDHSSSYNLNHNSAKSVTVNIQKSKQNESQQLAKRFSLIEERLHKQNNRLKSRNKKLVSLQAKVMDNQSQIEQFFIRCVEQLKRQIMIRKKIDYCSLQQFKKEDKLMLMIKVLSNNEILAYLHERLFRKQRIYNKQHEKNQIKQQNVDSNNSKLPKINFALNYQYK